MEVIYELKKSQDGSVIGIGNSVDVERKEAVKLIKAGSHKAADYPIGEIPKGWEPKKRAVKSKVEEEE